MDDGVRLSDDQIEQLLHDQLAAHPDATIFYSHPVTIVGDADLSGLGTGDREVLGPIEALELIHPDDRPMALTSFERLEGCGYVCDEFAMADGSRALSYVFDTRPRHEVYVGLQVLIGVDDTEREASSRGTVPVRVAHVVLDGVGNVIDVDEAWTKLFGFTRDEGIGRSSLDAIHPDDRNGLRLAFAAALAAPDTPQRVRCRRPRADGSYLWCEVTIESHPGDLEGSRFLVELVDISLEMAAHEQVRARERLLHRLAESLPQGIVQIDGDGVVLYANALAHRIIGADAVTLDALLAKADDEGRSRVSEATEAALRCGQDRDLEVSLCIEPGAAPIVAEVLLRPLADDNGDVTGAIVCIADVTERTQLRRELEVRATFDTLTGVYNRDATMRALQQALERREEANGVAVVFVDLDRFKVVNDRHGHAAGDGLLKVVAERMLASVRGDDLVGRIGGDEFLLVCPAMDSPTAAMKLAERVADRLLDPASIGVLRMAPHASIGVAWTAVHTDAELLMAEADAAMYRSKRDRNGRPVMAKPPPA